MSSGACRALVAVVLTLVATIVMTLPVVAESRRESRPRPSVADLQTCGRRMAACEVTAHVSLTFNLGSGAQAPRESKRWGPIVVERDVEAQRSRGRMIARTARPVVATHLPGIGMLPGESHLRSIPTAHPEWREGSRTYSVVSYTHRRRSAVEAAAGLPARVDRSYVFICVSRVRTSTVWRHKDHRLWQRQLDSSASPEQSLEPDDSNGSQWQLEVRRNGQGPVHLYRGRGVSPGWSRRRSSGPLTGRSSCKRGRSDPSWLISAERVLSVRRWTPSMALPRTRHPR